MACLRHTTWTSVIPFLPSDLAERPLRRLVTVQSSHLERLHHRLHEEQKRRRQEQEQHGSSFSLQQEIESVRSCSPVLPLEAPPAPPLSAPAAGVAVGGDLDDGGSDSNSCHSTDLSADQEPCYARHSTGVHGPSSIAVWSSSIVTRFTRTTGRRPVWCAVRRTVSRVRRSAQSTILSLSRTQLRHPCKMPHGVRFRTTAWCSTG
jgi:hypothetical protein